MKKLTIVIAWLLYSANVEAQQLDQFLKEAAGNNPELKARFYEFEVSMQKIAQVKSLPDPTLSIGVFLIPRVSTGPQEVRFSISQMFPWFGTLKAKGEVSALLAEAKFHEFLDARNKVWYEVKLAYYPLVELQQIIQLQNEYLEILKTYKTITTSVFENAKGSLTDILRLDILIENSEIDIRLLEEKKQPLEARLKSLLNRTDAEPITLRDSLQLPEIPVLYRYDSLLINHPSLTSLDKRIESVIGQEIVARKESMPRLGVGADYLVIKERADMAIQDNGKNAFMPMVTLTLPVYRNKYRAGIEEARIYQKSFREMKKDRENYLQAEYSSGSYEIEKSRELIELYDQQIGRSEQIRKLLISAYRNSGDNFLEVLRIQQEILKYQLSRITATKSYILALAKLDYLTHN